ncbi:MAG: mannose-6-phosphate isomerase, class I [Candidatus Nanopelagicales bacterium]|nr:mannose-6-phosphate isomerase, class I [Candidatus Nanopelagicales bacterium]MCF8536662.1 mannose-6-phosphate isomerase, class I [Candidatus Nanopelagicales bacterium]MCF8541746.1 mannose-6-phosphate isomerase, class I [Candidatus Nanopelagicales bacterium]MCF8556033.1 mannose-6-phosphate isomerase, class I [Candidatus Nanopelagicales bacterium]
MLLVRGAVKAYDWGLVDGLARWSESTGEPQAELWFGVHPGGPSPLLDGNWRPTGEHLGDRFDVEAIPLLVKLLAAAKPLSVQVHPRRHVAADQYALQREDEPVIYTDPFEKTEMLIALEDFEAFAGWRAVDQSIAFLEAIEGTLLAVRSLRTGTLADAIRVLLELGTPERIASLPEAARVASLPDEQVAAYATVADLYPDDAGALLTPLLDYLRLAPGEAVYVPAGVPHSYIRGTGLEVMSSSDNVVRLGLTSKPVHVDHAIAALVPDLRPQVLRTSHGDLIWPIDSPFVVRVLRAGEEKILSGSYRIVLLIEGAASVESVNAETSLREGTAAVMDARDPDALVRADGLVAIIQSTER